MRQWVRLTGKRGDWLRSRRAVGMCFLPPDRPPAGLAPAKLSRTQRNRRRSSTCVPVGIGHPKPYDIGCGARERHLDNRVGQGGAVDEGPAGDGPLVGQRVAVGVGRAGTVQRYHGGVAVELGNYRGRGRDGCRGGVGGWGGGGGAVAGSSPQAATSNTTAGMTPSRRPEIGECMANLVVCEIRGDKPHDLGTTPLGT